MLLTRSGRFCLDTANISGCWVPMHRICPECFSSYFSPYCLCSFLLMQEDNSRSWEPESSFVDSNGIVTDLFQDFCSHHKIPTGSPKKRSQASVGSLLPQDKAHNTEQEQQGRERGRGRGRGGKMDNKCQKTMLL